MAVPFFYIMVRILAIDYGRRRIGLAVSDALGMTANGLSTLKVKNKDQALEEVIKVIRTQEPGLVVVGLPLNMDGTRSEMAQVITTFVDALKRVVDIPIELFDERLTSVAAHRTMKEMGVKQKGNKGTVDRLAAVYLLETFLQKQASLGAD